MIEINKNILRKSLLEMEENSYKNLCIVEDATVNPFAYVYIKDIDTSLEFKSGFNKNGKWVYFTLNKEDYVKFSLSINLNNKQDMIDRKNGIVISPKFITLKERSNMNRNTLEVYVDGLKIPDNKVLITLLQGSTDLYVPISYINKYKESDEPIIQLVLNKFTNDKPYYNSYSNKVTSNTVKLPFIPKTLKRKKDVRIYKNGYILDNFIINGDIIRMKENILSNGDEYEFIYRHDTEYNVVSEVHKNIISFPKNVLKDKPVYIDNYEGYINGRRQFPKDLVNKTSRHIFLNNYQEGDEVVSYIRFSDKALSSKNHFIDDITRFFDFYHKDAADIILGEYKGFLPEYIENMKFPEEVIKVIDQDRNKFQQTLQEFTEESIKKYIIQNPENFKYFLNNMVQRGNHYSFYYDDFYNYTRNDTYSEMGQFNFHKFSQEQLVFHMKKTSEADDYMVIFIVDGKKLGKNEITIFPYRNSIYAYVNKKFFKEDSVIESFVFPIFNGKANRFVFSLNEAIIPKKKFGYVQSIDDLLIMKRSELGWVAIDNKYSIKDSGDNYIFTIDEDIYNEEDEYLVYNSSFSLVHTHYVSEDEVEQGHPTKVKFDLYNKDDCCYYPMTSFYSPIIFVNDKMMIEDLDYKVITQYYRDNRNIAQVFFKKKVEVGDRVDIYYTETFYEELGSVEYVDSEYGVVYFKNLKVPFDSGYIDVYVDGILIDPSQIEVISTNIIKINGVKNLIDIRLHSKLSVPLTSIKKYTEYFLNNPSTWNEYIMRYWINKDKTDDFYKKWNEDGLKVTSNPNDLSYRIDLLANEVAYQLVKGLTTRLIDCNIYFDFSKNDRLRELMYDGKDYIDIDCNRVNYISEEVSIDATATLRSYSEIITTIFNKFNGIINAVQEIDEHDPLWLEIYEDELSQCLLEGYE